METKQSLSIMEAASEATERLAKALAIKEENQQDCDFLEGYNKGYNHGAEWQKEQDKQLITALKTIAAWPGNLPDERYTSKTGANDAALRGGMVVAMRAIANEVLKKLNL